MSRLAVGPFNRAEGNLEIKLDAGDAAVAAGYVNSPHFRGVEQILLIKTPADAMIYAPRICSHCSVSQSIAAAHALAKAQGLASIQVGTKKFL
jgi:uptake hydrogenase large subunit